jgi:hypothetical protein
VDFDVTGQLLIILFCTSKIHDKKWKYNDAVHHLFVNFKKAYDSVRREVLCNILIEFGTPTKRLSLKKCAEMKPITESGGRYVFV